MAFAHTEKPRGAGRPNHNPAALDALSSLVRRGGHNIHADQIQKPVQAPPQGKPQSPIAGELMARSMPQEPLGDPFGQSPEPLGAPPMPAEAPPMPMEEAPPMEEQKPDFPEPPYDGYYGELFAKRVKELKLPKGHWAHEAMKKFQEMDKASQRIRGRIQQIEKQMAEE